MMMIDLKRGLVSGEGVRFRLAGDDLMAHHKNRAIDLVGPDYRAILVLGEGTLRTPQGPRDLPGEGYHVHVEGSTLLLRDRAAR